jgi:laminin B (domain IV)/PEP-CTERM motif-containing protein
VKRFLLAAAVFGVFGATAARADIVSTFDAGAEGWTALDAVGHDYTASWVSTGGNPGGFLSGNETDPNSGTGYFIAPSAYNGNLTAYLGGTLSYQINVISGTAYYDDVDVMISNGADTASWSSHVNPVGQGWDTFTVQLNQTNFGSDIATILANVTSFKIRGEFIGGPEEEGLDNVSLTAATSAVPEPSTWAMMLLGFAGLGFVGYMQGSRSAVAA